VAVCCWGGPLKSSGSTSRTPRGAQQNAQRLISENNVAGIVGGSLSSFALAESAVCKKAGIPFVAGNAAGGALTASACSKYTFRLRPPVDVHTKVLAPYPTGFDFVCNATPAGMKPGDPLPLDASKLIRETYVGCVITSPTVSPLIAAAREIGCVTGTGGEMYAALQEMMVDFLLFADKGARA
jgi:hypothetical protein